MLTTGSFPIFETKKKKSAETTGSDALIECGKNADILLVSEKRGIAEVKCAFVEGKIALTKSSCLL
jgi:alpha-D-ribose 1-methylphosphonate 5-triphosphate diphosphatase PhnM